MDYMKQHYNVKDIGAVSRIRWVKYIIEGFWEEVNLEVDFEEAVEQHMRKITFYIVIKSNCLPM